MTARFEWFDGTPVEVIDERATNGVFLLRRVVAEWIRVPAGSAGGQEIARLLTAHLDRESPNRPRRKP